MSTSFLNALSRLLSLAGRYEEALEAADRALAYANSAGLSFVRPHGLLARAVALLGIGAYGGAGDALSEAEALARTWNPRSPQHHRCEGSTCEAGALHRGYRRGSRDDRRGSPRRHERPCRRARRDSSLTFACAGQIVHAAEITQTLPGATFLPDAAAFGLCDRRGDRGSRWR